MHRTVAIRAIKDRIAERSKRLSKGTDRVTSNFIGFTLTNRRKVFFNTSMSLQHVKYTESNMNIHLQIFPSKKNDPCYDSIHGLFKFSHFVCKPKGCHVSPSRAHKGCHRKQDLPTSIAAASVAKKAMRCSGVVRSAIHKANTTCASPVNETHGTVNYKARSTYSRWQRMYSLKIIVHNAWERSTDHQAWTQHEAATTERA